jgi:hypothetical protein
MDLAQLQELKRQVLQEKELAPVWSYFLDHFGEDPDFIALGERTRHAFVEAVLEQVGQQLFARDGAVSRLILTRVADQQFIHGGFSMGGRIGGVFFFEEARIGLLAVADTPPSIEVKYARFSGYPVRRPVTPSQN